MDQNKMKSKSIFQRRIAKFKSIKRAYYSLIILASCYLFSLLASFFVSSTALIIKYSNGKYDLGEEYIDSNQNNQWDENE